MLLKDRLSDIGGKDGVDHVGVVLLRPREGTVTVAHFDFIPAARSEGARLHGVAWGEGHSQPVRAHGRAGDVKAMEPVRRGKALREFKPDNVRAGLVEGRVSRLGAAADRACTGGGHPAAGGIAEVALVFQGRCDAHTLGSRFDGRRSSVLPHHDSRRGASRQRRLRRYSRCSRWGSRA